MGLKTHKHMIMTSIKTNDTQSLQTVKYIPVHTGFWVVR